MPSLLTRLGFATSPESHETRGFAPGRAEPAGAQFGWNSTTLTPSPGARAHHCPEFHQRGPFFPECLLGPSENAPHGVPGRRKFARLCCAPQSKPPHRTSSYQRRGAGVPTPGEGVFLSELSPRWPSFVLQPPEIADGSGAMLGVGRLLRPHTHLRRQPEKAHLLPGRFLTPARLSASRTFRLTFTCMHSVS